MDDNTAGFEVGGLREISILQKLKHRNIIELKDIVAQETELGIILPKAYCTLDIAIKGCFLKKKAKYRICKQIIDAVAYMHSKNIMHRDIKPDNILLFRNKNGEFNAVIADFSIAKSGNIDAGTTHTPGAGTACYRSPEIIKTKNSENISEYNMKVDEWSLGVLMFELYNGKLETNKDENTLIKIKKLKETLGFNNSILNVIINGFLEFDQKRRLRCSDALSILSRNEYVNEDSDLLGIEPIRSVKKIAKRFNIDNDLTLRMATLYVKRTGCDEKWAVILATKLFEVNYSSPEDDDEKDEYRAAELSILKDMSWKIV